MLRNIKLSVDAVQIAPGSTLAHVGTSYQVSRNPEFTGTLVLNVVNSASSLLSHTFECDVYDKEPLYVRTRYHYNNAKVSSWSRTIELTANQVGIKSSDTIVGTPGITVEFDYTNTPEGELVATIDNLQLYAGAGSVISTSWRVETTDGYVLYELPKTEDVLRVLRLPKSVLQGHKAFVVIANTHSNNNQTSNPARSIRVIDTKEDNYFTATLKNTLYRLGDNYLIITDTLSDYVSVDVTIERGDGSVVESFTGLDPYVARFTVGDHELNGWYVGKVRLVDPNGKHTPWVIFHQGPMSEYGIHEFSPTTTYTTDRMGFGSYINIAGMSSQTSYADEDDVFYLAVPGTDTLQAYRGKGNSVYPIGLTHDLGAGELFDIPTVNILRRNNGDVILDHSVATSGGEIEVAKFTFLDYNHVTKKLTKTGEFLRSDERYGTGRTNSAVVTREDLIYYVPGEIFDANGEGVDLELRVFDMATNTIIDNIPLPVTGLIENVSLAVDGNNDIYMFGGSSARTDSSAHNEDIRVLKNKKLYKLDKVAKTWTMIYSVPLLLSVEHSYRYRMHTLCNGDILIADATPDVVGTASRYSYVYSPSTNTITRNIYNNPRKEHVGISIEFRNGDIGFISSTPEVVESVSFFETTTSPRNVSNTLVYTSQAVTDLVVPQGERVFIRDPYRYATITIEGTSLGNTGKLVWIRNDEATEYHYDDLIVTRNMTLPVPAVGQPEPSFNRVVVVGDAILTIL